MSITAAIIDDEEGSRFNLQLLLEKYCPEVAVVGLAKDVPSGLRLIEQSEPDVIFLDIEMPGQDGFALIEKLPTKASTKIVFVTAYQQYAIRAFRVSAVDYLLKPIDIRELQSVVGKLKKDQVPDLEKRMDVLKSNLKQGVGKIAIPHQDGFAFLAFEDIILLEAKRNYTDIHRTGNKKFFVAKSLREFEEVLIQSGFFRPHRSFVINLRHVEEWVRKDGGYILMSNQKQVPLVKTRRADFLECYQAL